MRPPLTASLCLFLGWGCGPGVNPSSDTTTGTGTNSDSGSEGITATVTDSGDSEDTGMADAADSTTTADPDPLELHIEAYCQAWLSIECPRPRYDSVEECIEHYGAELEPWAQMAEAGAATFDEECGAAKVQQILGEELACPEQACRVFHGFVGLDEECTPAYGLPGRDCDYGLFCVPCAGFLCGDPTCRPWCTTVDEGEVCTGAACPEGQWCIELGSVPTEPICQPIPGPGDPCPDTVNQCGLDLWCDDGICSDEYGDIGASCADTPCDVDVAFCDQTTEICVEQLPLGSACTLWYQCDSRACVADECAPLPDTVGAPCHLEKWCGGDLECDTLTRECREPYASPVCNVQSWCKDTSFPNGVCQEGDGPDECPPNSDASDCGYCPEARQGDGACDETQHCAEGTDPDCR